ncbi:hypothetical protein [Aquiflexum balticum]|nr:hypothetical protein [Aquiflexum balticum]
MAIRLNIGIIKVVKKIINKTKLFSTKLRPVTWGTGNNRKRKIRLGTTRG